MSTLAIHRRLHALGEATARQVAEGLGLEVVAVSRALSWLCDHDKARTVKPHHGRQPAIYASTEAPQAYAMGVSGALGTALYDFHTLPSQMAAIAGVSTSVVHNAIDTGMLDSPDSTRQVFTRPLAAETARRLAKRLEDRAGELRTWAARADAAAGGES